MIKKLLVGLLSFSATLACGITTLKKIGVSNEINISMSSLSNNNLRGSASEYCIPYNSSNPEESVREYFEKNYINVYSIELIEDNSYYVPNYDQGDLNERYNDEYGLTEKTKKKAITNTCTLVACMEVVDYYSNIIGEFTSDTDEYELYMKVVNACLKAGCTSRRDGTGFNKIDDCVDASFKRFGSKRRGDTNIFFLDDNVRDAVRWRSALIYDLPTHSTVVRGIVKFKVKYSQSPMTLLPDGAPSVDKVSTKTVEFIHISEGYGRLEGSLIPFYPEIGRQVTWAKK